MQLNLRPGLLVLAALSFWPAVAAADDVPPPPCSRVVCKSQINAMCGSLKDGARSDCTKGVISACKSGQIVCAQGTTTTTAAPTTTTAAPTTTTAAPTTTTAAPTTTTAAPTTTTAAPTTTTAAPTTTTSSTTTTTAFTTRSFTTAVGTTSCGSAGFGTPPASPVSGELDSDTACTAKINDLGLGCLYFGGGMATVVAGGKIPDGATSLLHITGPSTLGPSAGSGPTNCTRGAGPGRHCVNNNSLPACTNDGNCGGAAGSCALDP